MLAQLTRTTLRLLDRLGAGSDTKNSPAHHRIGRRGEEEAYFYLRKLGYVMVARNYRSARRRGEIDLIGWDRDVRCFIEVKTRTSREVKPAEAAVDREKRRELAGMAFDYLRHADERTQWRFDVISVYFENSNPCVRFELFKNAFSVA